MPFADNKQITLVHGMNTLGKTTFTQILKSLGNNEPIIISKRQSIPPTAGLGQKVEFKYNDIAGAGKSVKYGSGTWTPSDLKDHILVFDQEFIYSHVMTGDHITRENKVQFTDFVLGDAGVKLSQEIETDRKTLRTQKQRLPDLRPDFVKGATDAVVKSFVDLEVTEDTPTLEKSKDTDEKRLRRLESLSEFQSLNEPVVTTESAENDLIELQQEFTLILNENYDKVSDDAWQILQSHISANCNGEESVSWLKRGLKLTKKNDCPFCGQGLGGSKVLIDAYKTIFDEQFEQYDVNLKQRIKNLDRDIKQSVAKSYVTTVNEFIKKSGSYKPYIQELETDLSNLEAEIKLLEEYDQEFKVELANWSQQVQTELETKSVSMHKSMSSAIDETQLLALAKKVSAKQSDIRKIENSIKTHITNAKDKVKDLKPEQVSAEIASIESRIKTYNTKIARLAQNDSCTIFIAQQAVVDGLKISIDKKVEKLETEQSDFLKEYFGRLDHWFKQLGSDPGFKIEKFSNDQGDKKVYTLALKYHGERISAENFSKVFSESDKRNLALAIFLSKAEKLNPKKDYVLVLDDPVVSFDDNRRRNTCRILKVLATDFRQIIVTTHYSSLVKHFVDLNVPAQYVTIESEADNSCLKVLDTDKFVMNPHQLLSDEIVAFADGAGELSSKDLRPFMEEHLYVRFSAQLNRQGIGRIKLGDLIIELNTMGLIDDANAVKLHGFRETFNPDLHQTGEPENIVEQRTDARQLIDLLYGDLK